MSTGYADAPVAQKRKYPLTVSSGALLKVADVMEQN
jgi:hypothetical protein